MSTQLLQWRGLVDLFVLTAAIYLVLYWSREARALRVTFGILTLEAGAIACGRIGLPITSWVLHAAALVAALILIVLFQPELRHALNRLEITLRCLTQRRSCDLSVESTKRI
jgi:DNA integrity scanning protein DisA with diadenylate cyclase activity